MPRKSDNIIRVGDKVHVLRTTQDIKRVGYALVPSEITEEMLAEVPMYNKILNSIGLSKEEDKIIWSSVLTHKAEHSILDALKYDYCVRRQFGGNERTIHRYKYHVPKGEYYVLEKQVKVTGTRYDGYMDYWNHDYEWGGLNNAKRVTILTICEAKQPFIHNTYKILSTECVKVPEETN
jgi:hypothetical protein